MLPEVPVTLSAEVCPEVREYERFTTATANAYVRPMMEGYLTRLEDRLEVLGFTCPVLLMTSGGGLTTLATAKRQPIRLVESGPAGGVVMARALAQGAALDKVMSSTWAARPRKFASSRITSRDGPASSRSIARRVS